MSRIHRAYLRDLPSPGKTIDLEGPDAHHLSRVLRVKVGEQLSLFDGEGRGVSVHVVSVSKRSVSVQAVSWEPAQPVPRVRLELAVGLPDRKRAQRMLEALAELGVARLIPLRSERSNAPLPEETLRRWALESAKQSGRNTLLEVAPPVALAALEPSGEGWVADPTAEQWAKDRLTQTAPASLSIVVGPPGGLSNSELQALSERGFRRLRLTDSVLRVETAATAFAACVAGSWPPEVRRAPDA